MISRCDREFAAPMTRTLHTIPKRAAGEVRHSRPTGNKIRSTSAEAGIETRKRKHRRNTAAMQASLRCGAKTRSGSPCRSPAVAGKRRCRMHGGAKGSGATKGNRNALKHGEFATKWLELRRKSSALARSCREMLRDLS